MVLHWYRTRSARQVRSCHLQSFADHTTLDVNLFAPSELNWKARKATIRQTTNFPYEPATTIAVNTPGDDVEFELRIRHPGWLPSDDFKISLNGKVLPNDSRFRNLCLSTESLEEWRSVRVELPMRLRTEILPHAPEYVAFLHGPIVLSGELGRQGGLVRKISGN